MHRRPERFALFALLVAGAVAAAYFLVMAEADLRARHASSADTRALTEQVRLSLVGVRAGQEAYIAQGQDAEEWMARVSDELETLEASLEGLTRHARALGTATVDLGAARTAVDAFLVIDDRVREYVQGRNPLPASDLIFEDGMRTAAAIDAHVVGARRTLEQASLELDSKQRRTMGGILGAWLLGTLAIAFVLLRMPVEREKPAAPASAGTAPAEGRSSSIDDWFYVPPRTPSQQTTPQAKNEGRAGAAEHRASRGESASPGASTAASAETAAKAPPIQQVLPGVDLEIAAAVCTDLAQVKDAEQLAGVIGRAAGLLDASGLIVWISDSSTAELGPLVIHGYSDEVAREIPTIPYAADNVTAAAWRAGASRTVHATRSEPGGLAVPLLVNNGCVGVLTAEIGHGREQDPATLAIARIVAAQIATLLPSPTAAAARVEDARAADASPTQGHEAGEDLFRA